MNHAASRRGGFALLTSLILVVAVVSITGAMLAVSIVETRGLQETSLQKIAFYAAESGLEGAKYEINDAVDPDGDGVGNRTRNSTIGGYATSYTVKAEDLGNNYYRLTSTGVTGGASATLVAVVEKAKTTGFPLSAFSSLGNLNDGVLKIINNPQVTFDGGYSAAISVSDPDLFNRLVSTFQKLASKGNLKTLLTGATYLTTILDGKQLQEVQLPISQELDNTRLADLSALYQELVNQVNTNVLPGATKALPGQLVFGTAASPGVYSLPQTVQLSSGQTLSGYGTLVATDLRLPAGTRLTWNGTVILTGSSAKGVNVDLQGGSIDVQGNLVVLGEGKDDADFSVKQGSQVTVNGSFLLGTSYEAKSGKNLKVDMEVGRIAVNGIMTMLGGKIDAHFKPNGNLDVTGILQSGSPDGPGKEKQNIYFDGPARVVLNEESIRKGVAAWLATGTALNLLKSGDIVTDEVITHAWYQVHN